VSPDQFGEGGVGAAFGVGAEQLRVGLGVHSSESSRRRKNRTEIVASGIRA
jgi:hypothetical protein